MKNRISFLLGLSLLLIASSAHAQAPKTWVSGVGDDFNPCSRTAPCLTFAGAISRTAAGGEISALDPGDFGTVAITKSITIDGDAARAGIITGAGANAVIVNVPPPSPPTIPPTPFDPGVVILRGLFINSAGTEWVAGGPLVPGGLYGIRYMSGAKLVIENCSIHGFTQDDIEVSAASGNLVVKNTTLTGAGAGAGATPVFAAAIHLTSTTGTGTLVQVTNSLIAGNIGYGVRAEGKGTISVANSLLTNNGVAAVQADAVGTTVATVRLSNNEIFDNGMSIGCGSGIVASAGDNKKAGNLGDVRACRPTATVALF